MYLIADQEGRVIGKPEGIAYGFAIIGSVPRSSSEEYCVQIVVPLFGPFDLSVRAGTVNPNAIDLSSIKWSKLYSDKAG